MFVFEIATMPARNKPQRLLAKGRGGPTLLTARQALANALGDTRLRPDQVRTVASSAVYTWSDYPEYGLTVRAYPQPETVQCTAVSAAGRRCERVVSAIPDGSAVRCWQH